MNGRMAKKIRRELRRQENRVAAKTSHGFRAFVRSLPFRARLALAYKIVRGILVLMLLLTPPAHAFVSEMEFEALIPKIIMAESSGNPQAIGDKGQARGLMQIQRATWERFSKRPWREAFNPLENVRTGRAILSHIEFCYAATWGERRTTPAHLVYTYNTGEYCFGPIPPWTRRHPNAIYRRIFKGAHRGK